MTATDYRLKTITFAAGIALVAPNASAQSFAAVRLSSGAATLWLCWLADRLALTRWLLGMRAPPSGQLRGARTAAVFTGGTQA